MEQDPKIARALHLFGLDQTWANLYNTLDAIKDAVGGGKALEEKSWVSANRLDRFTRTANNRRVIGDEARHGHEDWAPPPNPMSIKEAKDLNTALISRLLRGR